MENKNVRIRVTGESETPTRMRLKSGNFEMIIDEPVQLGGTNTGPSPVQVLIFALGGCLNVTGNFVAREMGLPLRSLKLDITSELNPCKFMGVSDKDRAGFKSISVSMIPEFEGDVSHDQVEKWIEETERRCPVTDNIREATHINIKVKNEV